jgi:hypothetical protein
MALATTICLAAGGTLTGLMWNRPYYGLFSGLIQSVITIGIKELFGKKASDVYLASVVIYTIGLIGNEAQKLQYKSTFASKK